MLTAHQHEAIHELQQHGYLRDHDNAPTSRTPDSA